MEKEDTVSVQWAQEDVETSYSLLNNNIYLFIYFSDRLAVLMDFKLQNADVYK